MNLFINKRKTGTQFLRIVRVGIKRKSQQRTTPFELYRRDKSGRTGINPAGLGKTASIYLPNGIYIAKCGTLIEKIKM
jgi:hypothetical protein